MWIITRVSRTDKSALIRPHLHLLTLTSSILLGFGSSAIAAQPQNTATYLQETVTNTTQPLLNKHQKANGMLFAMDTPTVINLQFEVGADGKLDPDSDDNPGNDSVTASSSGTTVNGIVRTHDIMAYQWNYAIPNTGAVAKNVVLTATLSSGLPDGKPGQEWVEIPNYCEEDGSSISGANNETITCVLGDIDAKNQAVGGILQVEARVLGDTPHGTEVSATGSISADNRDAASTTDSGPVSATVSAAPKFDLRKTDGSPTNVGVFNNPSGEKGFVYRYKLAVLVDDGGVGSEPLDPNQNITIIDDLSQHAPNAVLYDWGTQPACAPNGTNNIRDTNLPYGKVGIQSGADATNSVTDSGNWACSQTGNQISIQITGADTTGNTAPEFKSNSSSSISVTERHVIAGYIHIWVPESDVNGSLSVTNSYQFLTAQGISGTANTEPDAGKNNNNNSETHTILTGSGSFNQYYRDADNSNRFTPLSLTNANAGNGVVMPGQVFIKWLNAFNNGSTDWENAIYCDKIDNRTQTVTNYPGESDPVQIETKPSGWVEGVDFVIEYGTGDENGNPGSFSSNYTNQRNATCGDGDSATPWTTDFSSLNAEDVTRVRFRALKPFPTSGRIRFRIGLTARNTFVGTGTQIPVGELLVNHSTVYADNLNGGQWRVGSYNPVNHAGSKAFGDRLVLTRAIVRIEKVNLADPSQEVNSADPLDEVTFELRPTVSSQIENSTPTSDDVIVEDFLPAELTYVDGSASIPPTNVEPNGGGTKITWNLGQRVPGVAITPITFKAQVGFDAANNATITNTAIISSNADGTSEADRTDTTSLSITNLAAYTISKTTSTPIINPDGDIEFTLSYANTGNTNFTDPSTIVDVFPYLEDGRQVTDASESAYNGTLNLQLPSEPGTNGETFEYTNATPASVDTNPNPAENTTTWCKVANFNTGGCPSSASEVTAIRITTLPFPKGEPTRNLTLRFSTNGNVRSDVYANNFTLHNSKLASNLTSQNVQVLVPLIADLELAKIVDNATPNVGNQVKFTITVNNTGPNDTTGVEVKDVLPTSLTYVSDNPNTGSFDSSTGTWTIGNLANGATANLEIVATVNTDGSITNTAQVSASELRDPDSTPNNNNASEDDQAAVNLTAAVASDPNVLLVKRITKVNSNTTTNDGDDLAVYKDENTNPYDDNTVTVTNPNPPTTPADTKNWPDPNTFLIGGINGGKVEPDDELEYTIYYLSAGDTEAKSVLFCDRIPGNVTFIPNSFNNEANKATGGLQNADRGILWFKDGNTESLTNVKDGDVAQYFPPGVEPSTVYPTIKCDGTNTNGAIVVNLGNLPNATAPGTPNTSYGYIRFKGRVK